ncbi:MAG TPA: hypothetical protein VF865_21830 [Acidobacteriaceae bacterium]
MGWVRDRKRVDSAAAKVWAWTWGAVFVLVMTVLSECTPALSGYTPPADQRTPVSSLPAAQSMK